MRKFDKAEALNVLYASDEEFEEMEPSQDVKSKACTGRLVKGRKHKSLQIYSRVLVDRNIEALPDNEQQGQIHGKEISKKSSDLQQAL